MRLHSSNKILTEVKSIKARGNAINDKPSGLWYGIDYAWLEWCESESFCSYKYTYKLDVDESKLLILPTVDAILAFNAEYAAPAFYGWHTIDWPRVALKYGGIEIAPYQWDLRFNNRTRWYYGWDIASGCIWDASLVKSITKIEVPNAQQVKDSV